MDLGLTMNVIGGIICVTGMLINRIEWYLGIVILIPLFYNIRLHWEDRI